MNKNNYYNSVSLLLNASLVFASILVAFYVVVPLFAGKFSVYAVVVYASWIATALALKHHLKRIQKGLRVRAREYILLCFFSVVNLVLWFWYPIGIILGVLSIVGFFFAYRAHDRQKRTEGLS